MKMIKPGIPKRMAWYWLLFTGEVQSFCVCMVLVFVKVILHELVWCFSVTCQNSSPVLEQISINFQR